MPGAGGGAARRSMPRAALRLHGRVVSLGGERAVEGIETGAAADEERGRRALGIALAERLLGRRRGVDPRRGAAPRRRRSSPEP